MTDIEKTFLNDRQSSDAAVTAIIETAVAAAAMAVAAATAVVVGAAASTAAATAVADNGRCWTNGRCCNDPRCSEKLFCDSGWLRSTFLSSASFWRGNQVGGLPRRSTYCRGHQPKRAPRNLEENLGEDLSRAGISTVHFRRSFNPGVL